MEHNIHQKSQKINHLPTILKKNAVFRQHLNLNFDYFGKYSHKKAAHQDGFFCSFTISGDDAAFLCV